MPDRSILFIDGNNWYHSLQSLGVPDLRRLDYGKISRKLVGHRIWTATRYYIGRVPQTGNTRLYSDQRSFLRSLETTDPRITIHLGRLESRPLNDPAAKALADYLRTLRTRIDRRVFHDLFQIAKIHKTATVMVEKAVDVMLAVDLVTLAERDQFDVAYLLSADGDFTPAAVAAKQLTKKVFAVSPSPGAQLAAVVDSYIRLSRSWFDDCYR